MCPLICFPLHHLLSTCPPLCLSLSSLTSLRHTLCFSFSLCARAVLGGWVRGSGGVGSSLSQKEMNPINQALVPVSFLPGPTADPALCSYVHLHFCPVENLVKPTTVNVLLFRPHYNKALLICYLWFPSCVKNQHVQSTHNKHRLMLSMR